MVYEILAGNKSLDDCMVDRKQNLVLKNKRQRDKNCTLCSEYFQRCNSWICKKFEGL